MGIPVVIDAILRGHKDGLDTLTLSFGSPNGFSGSAIALVASRIAKTGKVITSAGV